MADPASRRRGKVVPVKIHKSPAFALRSILFWGLLALAAAPLAAQPPADAPACSPEDAFLATLAAPEGAGPTEPVAAAAACPIYFCAMELRKCLAGCPCGFIECDSVTCQSICICPIWCPEES